MGPEPAGRAVTAGVAGGLSAMPGAGILLGIAPAAALTGWWMPAGMAVGAVAALAAAGTAGTVRSAGHRPGGWPGRVAGIAALVGRVAAGAAVAGAFGAYVLPRQPLVGALGAVLLVTVLHAVGFRPPALLTKLLVGFVLGVLGLFVVVCFAIAPAGPTGVPLPDGTPGLDDPWGVPAAAGVLFFAFLGFEAVGPTRNGESRRIRVALAVVVVLALGVYLAVGAAALRQLGGPRLALSPYPLRSALVAADAAALDGLLTAAAAVALLSALFAVLDAVRRAVVELAERNDLPAALDRAGAAPVALLGGLAVASTAALSEPVAAMAVAACLMLIHYAVVNIAWLRSRTGSPRSRRAAGLGAALSVMIAVSTAAVSVWYAATVLAVLVVGCAAAALSARHGRR